MEDLVSRIKNVNLTEIDANNRYIRSFISGVKFIQFYTVFMYKLLL